MKADAHQNENVVFIKKVFLQIIMAQKCNAAQECDATDDAICSSARHKKILLSLDLNIFILQDYRYE